MHYLLFYEVVEDYEARRVPLRAAHLALARRAVERGELVLGGALANPLDGAVVLFRGSSPRSPPRSRRPTPTSRTASLRAGASANGRPSSVPMPPSQ